MAEFGPSPGPPETEINRHNSEHEPTEESASDFSALTKGRFDKQREVVEDPNTGRKTEKIRQTMSFGPSRKAVEVVEEPVASEPEPEPTATASEPAAPDTAADKVEIVATSVGEIEKDPDERLKENVERIRTQFGLNVTWPVDKGPTFQNLAFEDRLAILRKLERALKQIDPDELKHNIDNLSYLVLGTKAQQVFEAEKFAQGFAVARRTSKGKWIANDEPFVDFLNRLRQELYDSAKERYEKSAAERETEISVTIKGDSQEKENRPGNEDSYFILEQQRAAGVFDGVGDSVDPELASDLSQRFVSEQIQDLPEVETAEDLQIQMAGIVKATSQHVLDTVPDRIKGRVMTTGTIGKLIEEKDGKLKAVIANVGDSRAYILRKEGVLEQITLDDNIGFAHIKNRDGEPAARALQEKFNNLTAISGLTKEEEDIWENRNVITEAIGTKDGVEVQTYIIEVEDGDTLLFTSDGIHDNLTTAEIEDILDSTPDELEASKKLIADSQARSREGTDRSKKDDMTAVVMRVKKETKGLEPIKPEIKAKDPVVVEAEPEPVSNEDGEAAVEATELTKEEQAWADTANLAEQRHFKLDLTELDTTAPENEKFSYILRRIIKRAPKLPRDYPLTITLVEKRLPDDVAVLEADHHRIKAAIRNTDLETELNEYFEKIFEEDLDKTVTGALKRREQIREGAKQGKDKIMKEREAPVQAEEVAAEPEIISQPDNTERELIEQANTRLKSEVKKYSADVIKAIGKYGKKKIREIKEELPEDVTEDRVIERAGREQITNGKNHWVNKRTVKGGESQYEVPAGAKKLLFWERAVNEMESDLGSLDVATASLDQVAEIEQKLQNLKIFLRPKSNR